MPDRIRFDHTGPDVVEQGCSASGPAPFSDTVQMLPVDQIVAGVNDRKVFADDKIVQLADSIDRLGLAQPITVRPTGDGWKIVAGERRFRAVKSLGWDSIRALVIEVDDRHADGVMLVENVQRVDLNPLDEGEAYQARMDRYGLTYREVAEEAGVGHVQVRKRLNLLRLCLEARDLVRRGQLTQGWADWLVKLDDDRQRAAIRVLGRDDVTYTTWRALCKKLLDAQDAEKQEELFAMNVDEWVEQAPSQVTPRTVRQIRADLTRFLADVPDDPPAWMAEWLPRLQAIVVGDG